MEPNQMKELMQYSSTFGLGIVLAVFGAIAFWKILNRVFDENAKRDERIAMILDGSIKTLAGNVDAFSKLLMAHDLREMELFQGIRESDKYQRDEHSKMIDILTALSIKTA